MPARPLWNEHAYHITNVNDDLTIPEHESASWGKWNSYRAAEQGIAGERAGIPDFTARAASVTDSEPMDCAARWQLVAQICNRGAGVAPKGIKGSFYRSDPRIGMGMGMGPPKALCTAQTTASLKPGECLPVSCNWITPDTFRADLWFRANDDGKTAPAREECRTDNDLVFLVGASCKNLQ